MSLEYRVIEMERRDPYLIAAMDQAVLEAVRDRLSPPTLLLHNWDPSVSIAAGQSVYDLNLERCRELGYKVVRMRTGGRAVVHNPDTEFSYSLFVHPRKEWEDPRSGVLDNGKTYDEFCGRLAEGLSQLGLPVKIRNKNDIWVVGGKLCGNAQTLKRNVVMQQGIVLYDKPDAQRMLDLMAPGLYNGTSLGKLQETLTGVREHADVSFGYVVETITKYLLGGEPYLIGRLTDVEQERIEELLEEERRHTFTEEGVTRGLCWLPEAKGAPPKGAFIAENPNA